MRILVATSTFPRWQGDREPPFVFELCRRLAEAHEVLVVAPHCRGAAVEERMAPGLNVRRFRYAPDSLEQLAYEGGILQSLRSHAWRHLLVPAFFCAELVAIKRLVRSFRPDVVHAHWLVPQGIAAVVARVGVPLLATSHGSDLLALEGAIFRALKRAVLRRCNAVTVVSAAMAGEAARLGADPAQVHVMPMGIDAQHRFTPAASARSAGEILFVGRLIDGKGIEHLLKAFALVRGKASGAKLSIVGSGPLSDRLKAMSSDLGLGAGVTFHGAIRNEELPAMYREAAATVLPSVGHEGFGLVLAEALACECPVVASDLPGVRDLVEDGVSGLLCRPGDPEHLANQILRVLGDRGLGASLARRGRQRVLERNDWDAVAQGYGRLLVSLAS